MNKSIRKAQKELFLLFSSLCFLPSLPSSPLAFFPTFLLSFLLLFPENGFVLLNLKKYVFSLTIFSHWYKKPIFRIQGSPTFYLKVLDNRGCTTPWCQCWRWNPGPHPCTHYPNPLACFSKSLCSGNAENFSVGSSCVVFVGEQAADSRKEEDGYWSMTSAGFRVSSAMPIETCHVIDGSAIFSSGRGLCCSTS